MPRVPVRPAAKTSVYKCALWNFWLLAIFKDIQNQISLSGIWSILKGSKFASNTWWCSKPTYGTFIYSATDGAKLRWPLGHRTRGLEALRENQACAHCLVFGTRLSRSENSTGHTQLAKSWLGFPASSEDSRSYHLSGWFGGKTKQDHGTICWKSNVHKTNWKPGTLSVYSI